MNDSSKKTQEYEKNHEYALELFSKGMCMGEVMKKTNLTEEEIARYREELDKN